jgi:hypothetical protein
MRNAGPGFAHVIIEVQGIGCIDQCADAEWDMTLRPRAMKPAGKAADHQA